MQQPQALPQEEVQEANLVGPQEQQFTLPSGQQIRIVNANLLQQLQAAQQQALQQQQQTLQQQSVQQQQMQQQQIVESNAMVAVNPKREPGSPPASPQTSANAQTQLVTLQQLQSFLPPHMQLTNAATPAPSVPDGTQQGPREMKQSLVSLQNIPGQFIQV